MGYFVGEKQGGIERTVAHPRCINGWAGIRYRKF